MAIARRSVLFLLFAATAACATAATFAPAQLDALHWRSIGPFRGGRVLAVAGVPGEREHFYFGSVNGGVWETRDAGRTWQPLFDAQPVQSIGALALAPSDPRVIYVGTGEADMRSDISQGEGVFRSSDGGRTWQAAGLADSQQIARLRVDPRDARRVLAAALGHPYGANAERGVFLSTDGGAHWRKVLGPNADTGAVDLAFEPGNPAVVYAALWQTRRTPWSVYPPSSGSGSGVYQSRDGGEHWRKLGDGLPAQHGRVGFALSPAAPQRVYAIVDAEPGGGLYRSDDAGAHWRLMSGDPRLWQRGWYFGEIAADPHNADRVYVLNTIVLRSDDGGAHFAALKGDTTGDDFHALWIDPNDTQRQILGVDQGAIVTLNGGASWSSWYNQPTTSAPTTVSRTSSTVRSRIPALPAYPAAPRTATASTSPTSAKLPPAARATTSRPIPPIRTSSTAAASIASTCARARRATSIPPWPIPTTIAAPGPCRSPSPCATPRCCISPTRSSTAAPTAVSTGTSSAPTSRAKTPARRRRWTHPPPRCTCRWGRAAA